MFEKHMPSGNDRAVSPVIGVVLMVGIVVALGAVVGGAVLGLGVGVGETAPNAQFDADVTDTGTDVTVDVEHVAGDTVNTDRLNVEGNSAGSSTDLTAGDTATFSGIAYTSNGEYALQWSAENGETSSVLATFDGPSA